MPPPDTPHRPDRADAPNEGQRGGPWRVGVLGATGTVGRATVRALVRDGHDVARFVRPAARDRAEPNGAERNGEGAVRSIACDVTDPASLRRAFGLDGAALQRFDAVVSCLASRTGAPSDAWAIDHRAHSLALRAAREAGVGRFVLVSAICVQRPRLAFQRAKLRFEAELMASGLQWTTVRPTALMKSLSGQLERVRAGKPFLLFGDGRLTRTKPIADDDLGAFVAGCLSDPARANRVLPIGGPGPALAPIEMGEMLHEVLGRPPRFRRVPPGPFLAAACLLAVPGRLSPRLAAAAEFARVAHYYATESMLVLDSDGRYDAAATPSTGTITLRDHYAALTSGAAGNERGAHAMF